MRVLRGVIEKMKWLTSSRVYYLEGELTPQLLLESFRRSPPPHFFLRIGTESCACKKCTKGKKAKRKSGKSKPNKGWVLVQ